MKKLFLFLAACVCAVACDPDDDPITPVGPDVQDEKQEVEFKIVSSNPMEVAAEGGSCVIKYTITNPDDALTVSATADVDWVVANTEKTGENELVFDVAENDGEARSATITVTYDKEYEVVVNQAAAAVEPEPEGVELPYLSAVYFGNQYGATENDYNYALVLSTEENVIDFVLGDYTITANNTYLLLDMFSSQESDNYSISFTIPEGEYVYDVDNTVSAGTVSAEYTYLYVTGEEEGEEIYFTSGKVTVTADRIEAEFVAEDGTEYRFFCNQVAVDNKDRFVGDGYQGEFSTLEDDLALPFEEPGLYAVSNGDYYVVGKNDWYLYVDDYATGHTLLLEVLIPLEDEKPVGEFVVSSDLDLDRMILPGFVSVYGEAMWSWYALYGEDGYEVYSQAPIVDGTLTITDNGDDTYNVVCDLVDDLGNKITGECVCYYEVEMPYMRKAAADRQTNAKRLSPKPVRSLRK